MAGSLVSDFGIGDTNIDNVMLALDKAYKGQMRLSISEYDTAVVPQIEAGSWCDNNGALYKFDSLESISLTDPVTSTTVADGKVWICLIPQVGTASGATTDSSGYSVNDTVITLASAGTGTILVGDKIQFAGDTRTYTVTSGDADVSNGGSVTIESPGIQEAIPTSATAITLTAGGVTASFTATEPTWSGSRQGWYGTGGQANYRHIAKMVKSGTSYTMKAIIDGRDYVRKQYESDFENYDFSFYNVDETLGTVKTGTYSFVQTFTSDVEAVLSSDLHVSFVDGSGQANNTDIMVVVDSITISGTQVTTVVRWSIAINSTTGFSYYEISLATSIVGI